MVLKINKIIAVCAVLPGMLLAFSSCVPNQPVPMKSPGSVEHSYSTNQVRAQDGVELLIQNNALEKTLAITDVALVRGKYVLQFNARISNTGRHALKIRTEPVWFDEHGVQMSSAYSQSQVHRLGKGQGISISHDAFSHSARTVRLIVDCPGSTCEIKD